ncbi:MAG: hypothetical protein JWP12_670 [Bacteroidetes bacterium]|nr:hypothetical protein [Bacteroidota bacterium]
MKQNTQLFFVFTVFTLIIGCSSSDTQTAAAEYQLTGSEKKICDSMQIDSTIIRDIRAFNTNAIEPFHYSLSKSIDSNGRETEIDPIRLNGFVFNEENATSYNLIFSLKDNLRRKGYSIFLVENNFNIRNEPDHIGVLKTTDKYTVLKQVATDGINYGITNDSLIKIIHEFDNKYSLDLIGASGDWCEFIVQKEPADWNAFANEVYKACPDVVDQGTGTVEELAKELKNTKRLYFWWD